MRKHESVSMDQKTSKGWRKGGRTNLTARRLARSNTQHLGRDPDRTLDLEVVLLGVGNQIGANLLKVRRLAAGQRDADARHLGLIGPLLLRRRHVRNKTFDKHGSRAQPRTKFCRNFGRIPAGGRICVFYTTRNWDQKMGTRENIS